MIISNSKKFIFVHIHKSGGTSVTAALGPTLQWNDFVCGVTEYGKGMEAPFRKAHGLHKHSHGSDIKAVVGEEVWQNYFTFSFVRNPYYRMASIYTWLEGIARGQGKRAFLRHFRPDREPWCWPGMKAFMESKDFSEFIRHEWLKEHAPGAKPMFDWLSEDDRLMVDYVGKVENMDADFSTLCDLVKQENLQLPKLNVSRKSVDLKSYYKNQDDFDLIYDRYQKDFEAFGYDKI